MDLTKDQADKTTLLTEEQALQYGYLYIKLELEKEIRMARTR